MAHPCNKHKRGGILFAGTVGSLFSVSVTEAAGQNTCSILHKPARTLAYGSLSSVATKTSD